MDGRKKVTALGYVAALENTISANKASMVAPITDPMLGMATSASPFRIAIATPTGKMIAPMIWSPPCTLASAQGASLSQHASVRQRPPL
jgi:hypothetical protein